MNPQFRIIQSDIAGAFIAVSEPAGGRAIRSHGRRLRLVAGSAALLCAGAALALPTLPTIQSGAANITPVRTRGETIQVPRAGGAPRLSTSYVTTGTTITQTTPRLAINWSSFDIGADETVTFVQPDRNAVALNRVTGTGISQINGQLNANGQVFVINPNGILFGAGAHVNVGGLVASSLALADEDFTAGQAVFKGLSGSVTNRGQINADDGYVALLGTRVGNEGDIYLVRGKVVLGADPKVTLGFSGATLTNASLANDSTGTSGWTVSNSGTIDVLGGQVQVLMNSKTPASTYVDTLNTYLPATPAITNSGVIRANTLDNVGGVITLTAGARGRIKLGGVLDASAPFGGDGGVITTQARELIVADDLAVTSTAAQGASGVWRLDVLGNQGVVFASSALGRALDAGNVNVQSHGTDDLPLYFDEALHWSNPNTFKVSSGGDIKVTGAMDSGLGAISLAGGRDVIVNAPLSGKTVNVFAERNIRTSAAADQPGVVDNLWMFAKGDMALGAAVTGKQLDLWAGGSMTNTAPLSAGSLSMHAHALTLGAPLTGKNIDLHATADLNLQDAAASTFTASLLLEAWRDLSVGGAISGAAGSRATLSADHDLTLTNRIEAGYVNLSAGHDITLLGLVRAFDSVPGHDMVNGGIVQVRADMFSNCTSKVADCGQLRFTDQFNKLGQIVAEQTTIDYVAPGSHITDPLQTKLHYQETDFSPWVAGPLVARMLVNDGVQLQAVETNLAGHYLMGRDIDASVGSGSALERFYGFRPIGGTSVNNVIQDSQQPAAQLDYGRVAPFTGSFDGGRHVIKGLTINRQNETAVGLFGALGSAAVVRDLTLDHPAVQGSWRVGSLAGYLGSDADPTQKFWMYPQVINVTVLAPTVRAVYTAGGLIGEASACSIIDSHVDGGIVRVSGGNPPFKQAWQGAGPLIGYDDPELTDVVRSSSSATSYMDAYHEVDR